MGLDVENEKAAGATDVVCFSLLLFGSILFEGALNKLTSIGFLAFEFSSETSVNRPVFF